MKKETNISFICNNCGKILEKDKEKSNDNWSFFNTNIRCSCGGKFKIKLN